VKLNTIKSILSIVTSEGVYLKQLDVKTAFLHENLDEEIYMNQPKGFFDEGKRNMVCRLKKILYGLKQALRLGNLQATCTRKVSKSAILTSIVSLRYINLVI